MVPEQMQKKIYNFFFAKKLAKFGSQIYQKNRSKKKFFLSKKIDFFGLRWDTLIKLPSAPYRARQTFRS